MFYLWRHRPNLGEAVLTTVTSGLICIAGKLVKLISVVIFFFFNSLTATFKDIRLKVRTVDLWVSFPTRHILTGWRPARPAVPVRQYVTSWKNGTRISSFLSNSTFKRDGLTSSSFTFVLICQHLWHLLNCNTWFSASLGRTRTVMFSSLGPNRKTRSPT